MNYYYLIRFGWETILKSSSFKACIAPTNVLKMSLMLRVPASSVVCKDPRVLVLVSSQKVRVPLTSRMQSNNLVHAAVLVILIFPLSMADPGFEQYFDQLLNDSRVAHDTYTDSRAGYETHPDSRVEYDGHPDVTSPDEGVTFPGALKSTLSPPTGIVQDILAQGRLE